MADLYTLNGSPKTVGETAQTSFSLASAGYISAGKTAYNVGTGWWIGVHGGGAKVAIGDAESTKYLVWDGTDLYGGQLSLGKTGKTILGTLTITAGLSLSSNDANLPNSNIQQARFSSDTTGSSLTFIKGRGTTASHTIVASGDTIGQFLFQATHANGLLTHAARIDCIVDGTPGASGTDMPGRLVFNTTPAASGTPVERYRISAAGQFIGGNAGSAYVTAFGGSASIVIGSDSGTVPNSNITFARHSTDASGPVLTLHKGRGTSAASTIVASGDEIGSIQWNATQSAGSNVNSARLVAVIDGTPAAGGADMPTRLTFWTTADGSGMVTERWRINNAGHFLGTTDNTYDIGASGATRPRTGYFGTSVVTPSLTISGLTSGRVVLASTGGLLADDSDLTFSGETLTAHTAVISTGNLTVSTGSALVSGNGSIFGGTSVDSTLKILVTGTARAVRIGTSAGNALIAGVDQTGTGSYQPLIVSGSTMSLGIADNAMWTVNASGHFLTVSDNTLDIGASGVNRPRTGYFGTSIITPKVESVGVLTLAAAGVGNGINFNTTSTTTQFGVRDVASAVNFLFTQGSIAGNRIVVGSDGSDTDVGIFFQTKGAGNYDFITASGTVQQFQILHTASANRHVTVTGSNGGNPTISTSAGSLAITPAVVMASTLEVNGASITTDDTTFACFNTNVTTVNAFGAASTALNIGNASGTTTHLGKFVSTLTSGGHAIGAASSTSTNLNLLAGTTAISSLRIAHGSAPTTPVDGDIWTTTTGIFVRINGATVGPLS